MKTYRVGKTFSDSILCFGEPVAREELARIGQGCNAWLYWGKSKHWKLCNIDLKTGELFTVHELELLAARGELK
jgi:hypothetical protein